MFFGRPAGSVPLNVYLLSVDAGPFLAASRVVAVHVVGGRRVAPEAQRVIVLVIGGDIVAERDAGGGTAERRGGGVVQQPQLAFRVRVDGRQRLEHLAGVFKDAAVVEGILQVLLLNHEHRRHVVGAAKAQVEAAAEVAVERAGGFKGAALARLVIFWLAPQQRAQEGNGRYACHPQGQAETPSRASETTSHNYPQPIITGFPYKIYRLLNLQSAK